MHETCESNRQHPDEVQSRSQRPCFHTGNPSAPVQLFGVSIAASREQPLLRGELSEAKHRPSVVISGSESPCFCAGIADKSVEVACEVTVRPCDLAFFVDAARKCSFVHGELDISPL